MVSPPHIRLLLRSRQRCRRHGGLSHHLRHRPSWIVIARTLLRSALLTLLAEDALEHRVLRNAAQEIAQVRLLHAGRWRALRKVPAHSAQRVKRIAMECAPCLQSREGLLDHADGLQQHVHAVCHVAGARRRYLRSLPLARDRCDIGSASRRRSAD